MKILILCKRRPMAQDLIMSPYGRFYHLARHLAELGHDVELWLFSYRWGDNETRQEGKLTLRSMNFWSGFSYGLPAITRLARAVQPDWVIGFSDTYYGIMATSIAGKLKARSLIDAYDNYESYMPLAWPLHWLWRRCLGTADRITCAGPSLADLLGKDCDNKKITILPMTADDKFHQVDKAGSKAREKFGLPMNKKLVGYHGSISRSRDIDVLFSAIGKVQRQDQDVQLVVSGRLEHSLSLPENVISMGYLEADQVPDFIQGLDLLVVTNKADRFGHYSYPVKLYEAMASGIPVVATKTRSTEWILRDHPQLLVEPGDADKLAAKIVEILAGPVKDYGQQPTWKELAVSLESCLQV